MADAPPNRILVGLDADLASMRAVETAAELARVLGQQLDLLTVLDLSQMDVYDDFYRTKHALLQNAEHERVSLLHDAVHRLGKSVPLYRARLRHGDVREVLVQEATQAEVSMLVVGRSRKSVSERILLGSVTRDLIRHCPVPLLLVDATLR